jgi:GNAT superfamily N-acetyltransferase
MLCAAKLYAGTVGVNDISGNKWSGLILENRTNEKRAIIKGMGTLASRSSSAVSIRRLTTADAEAAAELSFQLGYPCSVDDLRHRIEESAKSTDRVTFAAVLDGQVVGWIDAATECHLQSSACAVIGGLVVLDGARGFGIGRRLCAEVEEWARSKSIPVVRVRSQIKREDAHRFYLRDGYSKVKTSYVFEKPVL